MRKIENLKLKLENYGSFLVKPFVFLFVLFTSHFSLLTLSYAACPGGQTETELGCISENPIEFTKQIYGAGLGLIGGIGLLFIIYGAYLILSSQGDPTQLQKGKSYIIYSILGIILAIAGFSVYQIISVDVLNLPGFER
jgi:hypothetical protein